MYLLSQPSSGLRLCPHQLRSVQWAPQPGSGAAAGWLAALGESGIVGVATTSLLPMAGPESRGAAEAAAAQAHCCNLYTYQHRAMIAQARFNEVTNMLATCDEQGTICLWIPDTPHWVVNARYKWTNLYPAAAAAAGSPRRVVDMAWSHDGRVLVALHSDGALSVLAEDADAEQRHSYTLLHPPGGHEFCSAVFEPADEFLLLGTADGHLLAVRVLDAHPLVRDRMRMRWEAPIVRVAWNCPRFRTAGSQRYWGPERKYALRQAQPFLLPRADAALRTARPPRRFVLAVAYEMGVVHLLASFAELLPLATFCTGAKGIEMQWNAAGSLLAVAGRIRCYGPTDSLCNTLQVYDATGHRLRRVALPEPEEERPVRVDLPRVGGLHWGHDDACVFVGIGGEVRTVRVMRGESGGLVPPLSLLCCCCVSTLLNVPPPASLQLPETLLAAVRQLQRPAVAFPFPLTAYRCVEDLLLRAPDRSGALTLHCTLLDRGGGLCVLYAEYLGTLVPLLAAISCTGAGLRCRFALVDPALVGRGRVSNVTALGSVSSNIWKTKFIAKQYVNSSRPRVAARIVYRTSVLRMSPRRVTVRLADTQTLAACFRAQPPPAQLPSPVRRWAAPQWAARGWGRCGRPEPSYSVRLRNKSPVLNRSLGQYQLDCSGRVTVQSEKNCVFEHEGSRVLQFGRIGDSAYSLDVAWPFTPLQALAVALSSLTHGFK